jgi:hypothetical protein
VFRTAEWQQQTAALADENKHWGPGAKPAPPLEGKFDLSFPYITLLYFFISAKVFDLFFHQPLFFLACVSKLSKFRRIYQLRCLKIFVVARSNYVHRRGCEKN